MMLLSSFDLMQNAAMCVMDKYLNSGDNVTGTRCIQICDSSNIIESLLLDGDL